MATETELSTLYACGHLCGGDVVGVSWIEKTPETIAQWRNYELPTECCSVEVGDDGRNAFYMSAAGWVGF